MKHMKHRNCVGPRVSQLGDSGDQGRMKFLNQSVKNSRNSVRFKAFEDHTDAWTSVHCKSVWCKHLWMVQLELKLVHVHLVWWSYDVSFAIIRPHMQIISLGLWVCEHLCYPDPSTSHHSLGKHIHSEVFVFSTMPSICMKSFWNLLDKSFKGIEMIIFSNVHPVSAWKFRVFHGSKPWNISSKVRDGFFQDGSDPTGGEFPPKQLAFFLSEVWWKIHKNTPCLL